MPKPWSRRGGGDRRAGWAIRRLGVGLVLGALTTGAATAPARASDPSTVGVRRTAVVEAVNKAQGAVVNISSEKKAASSSRWPFSPEENQRPRVNGMGSGVIVDGRGYILTNHHVVDKVQGVQVQLSDGTSYPARVLQVDPVMDLALIKVDPTSPLPAIAMGTSSDLMVGEPVITIGNAFGYENTVSVGIISALHRDVTLSDDQVYRNLIQTDASINPGNSGGPLLDGTGRVIGINSQIATSGSGSGSIGIGFAVPIDTVKQILPDLKKNGHANLSYLGVTTMSIPEGLPEQLAPSVKEGAWVQGVSPGSPAAKAGIRAGTATVQLSGASIKIGGDVITEIDGKKIKSADDVVSTVEGKKPGDKVDVKLKRGTKDVDVTVTLGRRPDNATASGSSDQGQSPDDGSGNPFAP